MSFTQADVKQAVQDRGFGTDTAAQQARFLKALLRRIYGERRWRFLFKTNQSVAVNIGDSTVSLTTITDRQAGKIEGVRLVPATGDALTLEERTWEEVRELDTADSSNGAPRCYARQGNDTLQLWPRADMAYTLRLDYISFPTLPAADGDAITFPEEHQDVLAEGVAMMLAARQRDWNARNAYAQDYLEAYRQFASAQQINGSGSPATMGQWDGWNRAAR